MSRHNRSYEPPFRLYAVSLMFLIVGFVFLLNYPGSAPIAEPFEVRLSAAAAQGDWVEVESLISVKRNNASDPVIAEDLETALRGAALQQQDRIVAKLLERGVNPNAQGRTGGTVLMCTIDQHEDVRIARRLIHAGADVNLADYGGRTVLMDAIAAKNQPLVRLLLESGANLHVADVDGHTPLSEAQSTGDPAMVRLVTSGGTNLNFARKRSPAGV